MARPKAQIDSAEVEKLASFGCSNVEIASLLGVTEGTIRRRFSEEIAKGRGTLKKSLRRKQVEVALSGNTTMLIWLGKNMLDQTDKQELSGDSDKPIKHIIEVQYIDAVTTSASDTSPTDDQADGAAL